MRFLMCTALCHPLAALNLFLFSLIAFFEAVSIVNVMNIKIWVKRNRQAEIQL